MTCAAVIVRKSQGSDDDVSLEMQREELVELAEDLADDHDMYDFGVHTGFSIFSKARDNDRIDGTAQMQRLLTRLKEGTYDYVIAWDDTRMARDAFYWALVWHAEVGGAERVYREDVSEDDLTAKVSRAVETEVKKKEIKKSREAINKRKAEGLPLGRPPYGLQYNSDKTELEPGEDFDLVRRAFSLREEGAPYSKIEGRTGISKSTLSSMFNDNRTIYERFL